MYKVKSLISIEDDEEVKRKQEEIRLKRNNKRNSSVKSIGSGNNGGVSGFIHSIKVMIIIVLYHWAVIIRTR